MSSHDAWETKLEIRACSFDSSPAGGDKHRDCSSPNDSTGKSETSAEIFDPDPLRTLREILTYCQVMYEAIQKLDVKFEFLQARVTHTHSQIHVVIEEDQSKVKPATEANRALNPVTPVEIKSHVVEIDQRDKEINNESAEKTYNHQVPPSPEGSSTLKLVVTSEKPTHPSPSPQNQPQQSGSNSRPRGTVRKMLLEQRNVPEDHPHTNTGHSASPQTVREVLRHHRKSPDPQTHNATVEWVPMTYPEHDLCEKGKDWKACLAVMNEGARHIRLKDRKRKFKAVRDASEKAASVQEFNPEPTAEIDVELSDGDGEDLQQTTALKNKLERESGEEPLSENDCSCEPGAQVYLGHPDRDVKVPQFVMYSALQRPNPPLVARYLIRFIFPVEVLVQSNVYGNAKYGIQPLDHNKISALREYLCERFPSMKLDEAGPNWKTCVYAINAAIRMTRHALKKGPKQAREAMLMTS